MLDFLFDVFFYYLLGGLIFLPISFLTEVLFALAKGPEYSLWLKEHMGESQPFTFGSFVRLFAIWPISFIFWLCGLCKGRSMIHQIIVLKLKSEEKQKNQIRIKMDVLEKAFRKQFDSMKALVGNEGAVFWASYSEASYPRFVVYCRVAIYPEGLRGTHVILNDAKKNEYTVFRAFQSAQEVFPSLKEAQEWCHEDTEWLSQCRKNEPQETEHIINIED